MMAWENGDAPPSSGQRIGHDIAQCRGVEPVPGVLHADSALLLVDLESHLVLVVGDGVLDNIGARFAQGQADVVDAFLGHPEGIEGVGCDPADIADRLSISWQAHRHVEQHGRLSYPSVSASWSPSDRRSLSTAETR
jgi:hypothetical protein